MTRKARNLLVIFGCIALIGLSVAGYGIWSIYSFFSNLGVGQRDIPADVKEARVLVGSDLFTKKQFFSFEKVSLLSTALKGSSIRDEKERQRVTRGYVARGIYGFSDIKVVGDEIIAVGEFGGFILGAEGELKKEILFEPAEVKMKIGSFEQISYDSDFDDPKIVNVKPGKVGFLSFESVQGATLFDEDGNRVWNQGGYSSEIDLIGSDKKQRESAREHRILASTLGDLDGDGVSEIVIARNKDGFHVQDQNGNELWFRPDDHPYGKLYVVDLDGDGTKELLSVGNSISDRTGKILSKAAGKHDDFFLLTEGKNKKAEASFCNNYHGEFTCKNQKDEIVFESQTPLSEVKKTNPTRINLPKSTPVNLGNGTRAEPMDGLTEIVDDTENTDEPNAVWISFNRDGPKYLAVVLPFISIPRSNLYIFDQNGKLVYHELLDQEAKAIAILPGQSGNNQLLVGGKNTIWRYTIN